MFFVVVGSIVGLLLVGAGVSDVRRRMRDGTTTRVNDTQVSNQVRASRARARRARRVGRDTFR
jgi:hypothetical protein